MTQEENLNEQLRLLDEYYRNTSEEERKEITDKIDKLSGNGITIEEYLQGCKNVETNVPLEKDKYIIIDLRTMDYMKDVDGKMEIYDNEHDAGIACGVNEPENAWICKLIYNYKEEDNFKQQIPRK